MEEELQKLRNDWHAFACGIEMTHGRDDPAAKAFRNCIGNLAEVMQRHGMNINN
jgi:hypothetical protein